MYIDPSAGSLVLQAAVATGLSGAALLARLHGTISASIRSTVRGALASVRGRRPAP